MITKHLEYKLIIVTWVLFTFIGCTAIPSTPSRLKPTSVLDTVVFDASFDSGSLANVRSFRDLCFLIRPRPDYGKDGTRWAHQLGATWNGYTWWYHFSISVPEEHLPYSIDLEIDA